MPYKYNPLLAGKLDRVGSGVDRLDELKDVDTAGTADGYVLSYEEASGTWKPAAGGAGDMLKSQYDQNTNGTVDNSEQLEGQTLAAVRDHNVDAAKITTGTFNDERIPVLPTDKYGSAVLVSGTRAMTGNLRFLGSNRKIIFDADGGIDTLGNLTLEAQGAIIDIKSDINPHDTDSYDLGANTKYWQAIYAYIGYIPSLNANIVNAGTINTTTIQENVGGVGVTVDGCLIKDGTVANSDMVDGAHAGVGANKVFRIPAGIAQGDIFPVNAGGSVVRLAAGTTGHFLRTFGPGTDVGWAAVPGGGDMLKNVYDTGDNSIVDNSERLENNNLGSVRAHDMDGGTF